MINYNGLFEILDRREMKKTDLLKVISSGTLAKLNKSLNIQTEVLNKLCEFLGVQPGDIMEYYEIEKIEQLKKNEKIVSDEDILFEIGYRQRIVIRYPKEIILDDYEEYQFQDYDKEEIESMLTKRDYLISKKIYENIDDIKNGKIEIPKSFKNEYEIIKKDPNFKKVLLKSANK